MLFRNMARKYYSAAGGEGGEGGGGQQQQQQQQPPAIDPAELEAFKTWKAEQERQKQQQQQPPAGEDISTKLAREKQERLDEQARNTALHKGVEFYMGFDGYMAEHGHLFGGFDAKTAKEAHDKIESYTEKAASLRVVSAKAFFAVPANLELLIGGDRSYAASLATLGDSAVDAAKAWELVERAIHVATKSDYDRQVRAANGKGEAQGDRNAIDDFIDRCKNVGVARAAKSVQ